MRILIEEYQYAFEDIRQMAPGLEEQHDASGKVSLSRVGYFFSPEAFISCFLHTGNDKIVQGEKLLPINLHCLNPLSCPEPEHRTQRVHEQDCFQQERKHHWQEGYDQIRFQASFV